MHTNTHMDAYSQTPAHKRLACKQTQIHMCSHKIHTPIRDIHTCTEIPARCVHTCMYRCKHPAHTCRPAHITHVCTQRMCLPTAVEGDPDTPTTPPTHTPQHNLEAPTRSHTRSHPPKPALVNTPPHPATRTHAQGFGALPTHSQRPDMSQGTGSGS